MEYSGEYCICRIRYGKIKKRLVKNKTKTSSLTFPNGIINKVYLNLNYQNNTNNMFIYCPIDKDKKIKITKSESITGDDGELVMYQNIFESFESNGMLSASFYDVQRENELQRQMEENS